jgi:hypothetical protein
MDIFGIISIIILVSIAFYAAGLISMAIHINAKNRLKPKEKPQTKNTLYADRVINAAIQIYCNYNESKIIRPGQQDKQKRTRQGEAIQEALNLIGSAHNYFDILDSDRAKEKTKKPPLVITRPTGLNIN